MKKYLVILLLPLQLSLSSFAMNGQCSGQVIAPQGPGLVFRSTDNGNSWEDVSVGLPDRINLSSAYVQGTTLYVGTWDGDFYHNDAPGTGTWLQHGIGGMTRTQSINGIYHGISGTYVNIYEAGLFRKPDDGGQWEHITKSIEGVAVSDLLETEPGVIFITGARGIYRTVDAGKKWKLVYEGWTRKMVADGDAVIACGPTGLVRSTDGGTTWNVVLKDKGADYNFANLGGHVVALRVGGTWKESEVQRIYVSTDEGASWKNYEKFSPIERIYEIEQAGEFLFYSDSFGISRSADHGVTWQFMYSPAAGKSFVRFDLMVSGSQIYAVKIPVGC